MEIERRFLPLDETRLELRAESEDENKLEGYVSVYGQKSRDLGGFVEIIEPGCFTETIAGGDDIRALFNHSPHMLLGRQSNGTLVLSDREEGLHASIDLPDTTTGRDVKTLVKRRDITGCSFSFITQEDEWDTRSTPAVRRLKKCRMVDCGPVSFPAYPQTSIDVSVAQRGLEAARQAPDVAALEAAKVAEVERARVSLRLRRAR